MFFSQVKFDLNTPFSHMLPWTKSSFYTCEPTGDAIASPVSTTDFKPGKLWHFHGSQFVLNQDISRHFVLGVHYGSCYGWLYPARWCTEVLWGYNWVLGVRHGCAPHHFLHAPVSAYSLQPGCNSLPCRMPPAALTEASSSPWGMPCLRHAGDIIHGHRTLVMNMPSQPALCKSVR